MSKKSRNQPKAPRVGICTYCGNYGEVEWDHVIPRCLYLKGQTSPFKVDSCRPCNVAKSRAEDDLRDAAAISHSTKGHSNRDEILAKMIRAAQNNRSPLASRVRWASKRIFVPVDGEMKELVFVPADPVPSMMAIQYMVIGLYRVLTKEVLNPDDDRGAAFLGGFATSAIAPLEESIGFGPTNSLVSNLDVVDIHAWWFRQGHRHVTFWAITLLGGLHFNGFAGASTDGKSGFRADIPIELGSPRNARAHP